MRGTVLSMMGSIVESGSNANGQWVRYSTGLLVQWGYKNLTAQTSSNNVTSIVFPTAYSSAGYFVTTQFTAAPDYWTTLIGPIVSVKETAQFWVNVWNTHTVALNVDFMWMTVGY